VRVELEPEERVALVEEIAEIVLARLADRDGGGGWLYGARQASAYLGLPVGQVFKLTAAGVLPCHRLGSRLLFKKAELDACLENCRE
jgi:excisionase family DNA binding protein